VMVRFVFTVMLSLFASVSVAQDAGSLALIKRGGDAYLSGGADAAITAWLGGSALEGNTQATSQSNLLRQIEAYYGKPESLDIVKQTPTSPRSEMVYFTINYSKGIAYGRFQTYRTKSGAWISTAFKVNTEAVDIFAASLLSRD
jgi:hypothetical protein